MQRKKRNKFWRIWNYFKKGRNEIGLLLSVYSLILTYSLKFNIDFSLNQYFLFTLIFGICCTALGVFLAEEVEPQNNVISPYAQDSLLSAIALQKSLIEFYKGDMLKARIQMEKAVKLREKWLR